MPTEREIQRKARRLKKLKMGGEGIEDLPYISLAKALSYEWLDSEDDLEDGGRNQIAPIEGAEELYWVGGELSRGLHPSILESELFKKFERQRAEEWADAEGIEYDAEGNILNEDGDGDGDGTNE